MKRLYIVVFATLLSLWCAYAQERTPLQQLQAFIPLEFDYYRLTDERVSLIPQIDNVSRITLNGQFLSENLFDIYKKEENFRTYFEGIFAGIKANEGDIITMSFDFFADSMILARPTKLRPYTKRASVVDIYNIFIVGEESFYLGWKGNDGIEVKYDSDLNSVAIRQKMDGIYYPVVRTYYRWESDTDISVSDSDYKIVVSKYGKIAEIAFKIDEDVIFDLLDNDGLLKYNLLTHVHVKAKDIYGNDVPILNSLPSQWEINQETGIARFTPILYPFSSVIEDVEDAYEMDTNKSASTEEYNDIGITGVTLDNCMKLEAVNPDILLFDLNKSGSVTHVVNVNASTSQTDVWYSLAGQRLQGKPAAKGVYIHNGKKEVVK